MKIIAKIYTDFKEKFGIPRQSGICDEALGKIVLEPEYRRREAFVGIEGYSHLWLIWQFSHSVCDMWHPTVRPPRLGGNKRMGVFATRSPFRPNPIGLSSVRLERVEYTDEGPILYVRGADILDGTPIYDIKPYLAYTDSHPDAVGGFADGVRDYKSRVSFAAGVGDSLTDKERKLITDVLEHDPRPAYREDTGDREYGMKLGDREVFFKAVGDTLTVTKII